jgi:hypothetical protein
MAASTNQIFLVMDVGTPVAAFTARRWRNEDTLYLDEYNRLCHSRGRARTLTHAPSGPRQLLLRRRGPKGASPRQLRRTGQL